MTDAKERLARLGDKEGSALFERLTNHEREESRHDQVRMWRSLARRTNSVDAAWVTTFLELVKRAQAMPSYYALSFEQRRVIIQRIRQHAGILEKDLSGLSDAEFDVDGQKIAMAEIISAVADMAVKKIMDADRDPLTGAYTKTKQSITTRFARRLRAEFKTCYGSSLDDVVATVTNSLYGTRYAASGVYNLGSRIKRFAIQPPRKRSIANRKVLRKD